MAIDRNRLRDLFAALGKELKEPTIICLIGSTAGIMAGQSERLTSDIDVWRPLSQYDEDDFSAACRKIGILFDPKHDVLASDVYVQIVEPGIVALPKGAKPEAIAKFGNLSVVMASPAAIAASKLIRADRRDIEDIAWWMQHRALSADEIAHAIKALPTPMSREAAGENMVLVQLMERKRR